MLSRLSTRLTLSIALWIFVLAAWWLTAVPDTLQPSAYASLAVLLIALTALATASYGRRQAAGAPAPVVVPGYAPAGPGPRLG